MAINKKLIHFKKFSDFNSKKLSANEANTQYTVGVGGTIQNGTPDVLYQSICWIKDTKQQWTHGQVYDFSDSGIYYTDFTADDVYLVYQGEGGNPIVVTQELLDAINDNKIIIVPAGSTHSGYNMLYGRTDTETAYRFAFVGADETIIYNMDARDLSVGHIVNLAGEGFSTNIAYAPVNVGVDANSVVRRDDTGSINVIFLRDSAGKLCGLPTGNATEEAVGDYTLQDKLISGKNIKTVNGQTLLGSGDITISGGNTDPQYYVMTSYSFEDILNLNADGYTGWYSQNSGDFMNITNAFTQKIPVYIERNADDAYKSLIPVTGYAEDLLYLTITDGAITIYMECSINGDWEEASWSIYSFSDVEQQLSDKVGLEDLAKVASSGSYNDLSDKPTIPSAVTESTVSGWGFTKNTGTYSKPSGGIPKTDLASAVQTSLGKADTALQNHQQLKTINGQSLVGSGDITIEGGGGDDIRYFTEFTVSEFISACNNETSITSEGFFDAIMSNKIICVPYYNGSEGFLIASSSYMYQDTTEHHEFTCEIVYGLRQYTAMMSTSDLTYFNDTLAGLFPVENARQVIILDSPIIEYNDNVTYVIKEEVDELLIMYWGYKGSTISFNTGNNPTLVFYRLVVWANGVMPEIEPNTHYELSLVGTYDDSIAAVLTPFKPVE